MDNVPDAVSINSPNINSVLKPPKPRVPLKDLMTAVPEEDNTAVRKRRVSFANVNKIKEFSAGAESMVVCQTPAYEEPFSVSSDSSYPSGVDGWTPAKAQPSLPGKSPMFLEKENLSIHSQRMSSGMDLTNVYGNFDQNTRYSVNRMDLTNMGNSHTLFTDQQTRLSLGMELTNAVEQPFQNCGYSGSGIDLTNAVHSNQMLVDQRSRFSLGMGLSNVVGHSTQRTRYSMTGMDLTEAINPDHNFQDQISARHSIGMDMTDVCKPINTIRYSCNEMDLTEAAKSMCYNEQSCETGYSANMSMNDSDALELTEAVGFVQKCSLSPRCKTNNFGLVENVLYSINNTRFSGNSLDLTCAAGPRSSNARRKSSRFSLLNMDLTEAITNSLENVTDDVADPSVKTGCSRYSLGNKVKENATQLSVDNMEQTSIIGEQLEYYTDGKSTVNMSGKIQTLDVVDPSVKPGCTRYSLGNKVNENATHLSVDNMEQTSIIGEQLEYYTDGKSMVNMSGKIQTLDVVDPSVKPGCTRYSSGNKVNESMTQLSPGSKEQISIIGEQLEHYADGKSILNMSGKIQSNFKSLLCDKENALFSGGASTGKAPQNLETESTTLSLCRGAQQSANTLNPNYGGSEHNSFSSIVNSSNKIETCEKLNLSSHKTDIATDIFKDNVQDIIVNGPRQSMECGEHSVSKNTQSGNLTDIEKEGVGDKVVTNIGSCSMNETQNKLDISSVCHLKENVVTTEKYPSELSTTEDNHNNVSSQSLCLNLSSTNEFQPNKTGICIDIMEEDYNCKESIVPKNTHLSYQVDLIQHNEYNNEDQNMIEQQNDVMDVSITEESASKKDEFIITKQPHSLEMISKCSEKVSILPESELNMSIENHSFINEVCVEKIDENSENNGGKCGENIPVFDHNQTNDTFDLNLENTHNSTVDNSYLKDQSIELRVSMNTSFNLSPRSKNVTMTRGGSKNFNVTTNMSLDISHNESNISQPITVPLEPNENQQEILPNPQESQSKCAESYKNEHMIRGKRSFEAALEQENDTEESPVKQMCLSREDQSAELGILNDVTAPSFLMNTSHERLPSVDYHESPATVHQSRTKSTSLMERTLINPSNNVCGNKEFTLQMDTLNMSENTLQNEMINVCESSFDVTSTEARDFINNSRQITRNVYDDETIAKQNESCISLTNKNSLTEQSFNLSLLQESLHLSFVKDDPGKSGIMDSKPDQENMLNNLILPFHNSTSRFRMRKKDIVRNLGNNSYSGDFISRLVEIHFSIDSFDRVKEVSYHNSCTGTGDDKELGEYLLKQAKKCVLPEKGSDLIHQLQSGKKTYLSRLARNLNIICKFHNGRVSGDILTLEVVGCKNHFWTFVDINIKHPQYLSELDITISKQKIGELKLALLRKLFNSIEKNEDQLLNFVTAVSELQYDN